MAAAKVSGTVRSKNPLKGAVEILPVRFLSLGVRSNHRKVARTLHFAYTLSLL
jgi:hypothetical protein